MRPEQVAEYQEMVNDCQNREALLNDWETNFIDSIEEQLAERGFLSDKQISILERIWEKVTERG